MFKLRPYQEEATKATISHFQKSNDPAVVVLPTGAGKSLVIAELGRIARGRVLVLAHVKELVEQNFHKYESYDLKAGIYSAGLARKDSSQKVIFGSIQSVANADDDFFQNFSLLVIDECHRVSMEGETQYFQVIEKLKKSNPEICILGLTATPYRLNHGWIYEIHGPRKELKTKKEKFFKKCIYELSIKYMINNNFLTMPIKIDAPVASYDFSKLELIDGKYSNKEIESILKDQKRITPVIIENILELSRDREGVMIFTSSVWHAREILSLLPMGSALVTGETPNEERDEIIEAFKKRQIKHLVNVSVLTTGFDAPHVDLIAILRPTESVSLYQQIVGRGLRLSPGKENCLILDYTGVGHDIYSPLIEGDKPASKSVPVEVLCPQCGHENQFWGIKEGDEVIEHFGRECMGLLENPIENEVVRCGYLFRFKRCDQCGIENDISARICKSCAHILVDNDKKLKEAMTLKDAHIMKPEEMIFIKGHDKKLNDRLEIRYYDVDGEFLSEYFYLNSKESQKAFYYNFSRMHLRIPEKIIDFYNPEEVVGARDLFRIPTYIIARKQKKFWEIREKIF